MMVLAPANVGINHAKAAMIASRIVLHGKYFIAVFNAKDETCNCR